MSENLPPADETSPGFKVVPLINAGRPALYKMAKDGEEFYFDSTDLPEHRQEFEDMGKNGWVLTELVETLPAYLSARLRTLEQSGFVQSGWGYKKK